MLAATLALAAALALARPAASLAWLAGAHATPLQAAFHDVAVEHGHAHHHGSHDAARDGGPVAVPDGGPVAVRAVGREPRCGACGPEATGSAFAPAQVHGGFFQDGPKAAFVASPAPSLPDGEPHRVPLAESAPAQHFPNVPHRPPIPPPDV